MLGSNNLADPTTLRDYLTTRQRFTCQGPMICVSNGVALHVAVCLDLSQAQKARLGISQRDNSALLVEVAFYGLGSYDDGRPFYAMRFIHGENLKEAIQRYHESELCTVLP